MSLLISVYIKDSCYQLSLESGTKVTVGSSKRDTLSIKDSELEDAHLCFTMQDGKAFFSAKKGVFANGTEVCESAICVGDVFTCGNVSIYICPKQSDCEKSVNLSAEQELMIGRSRECHLCLSDQRISSRHAKVTFESGKYKIVDLDSKNHTFVNGRRIASHCLQEGDVISIAYYSIIFENGTLVFQNTGEDLTVNLEEKNLVRRYPLFRRSPRLGYAQEYNGIDIQPPPQTGEKPQINWLVVFLPPLVMTGVSVASMVMTEGDLMNLLFVLPMSFVTVLTTILSYFSQVRKHKKDLRKKIKSYDQYIEKVVTETKDCYQQQLSSVNQANPDTVYCYDIVSNRMRRLWERSSDDSDFLEVRLGKGVRPLDMEIHLPKISVGEDIPSQFVRLQDELSKLSRVRDIAVTLPLKKASLTGVVGNRQVAVKVIQNAVVQLATHHSYVDMNFIIVGDEKDSRQWTWTRWLPHCLGSDRQFRYVSSDQGQASELLGIFEDVLRKRIEMIKNDRSRRCSVLPWLVFVITDCALLEGRELLSLLAASGMEAGASAILLFDSLNKLPKECSWFIEVNNSGGCVYARENSTNRTSFVLDAFADYDRFARAMAPIRDRNAVKSSQLPASVTFYQGYGIQSADEIDLLKNWMMANPQKSLAAPLGTKENGKPFLFDIHEKAHGPHGLVAGTTGSGKSEVLQTWILSMCLNYSPQDVSFVLIDFKGMGLAGTLKGLPHIAGTISDVDENIQRNLFSLESELSRRKMLFADASSETMKIGDKFETIPSRLERK